MKRRNRFLIAVLSTAVTFSALALAFGTKHFERGHFRHHHGCYHDGHHSHHHDHAGPEKSENLD